MFCMRNSSYCIITFFCIWQNKTMKYYLFPTYPTRKRKCAFIALLKSLLKIILFSTQFIYINYGTFGLSRKYK